MHIALILIGAVIGIVLLVWVYVAADNRNMGGCLPAFLGLGAFFAVFALFVSLAAPLKDGYGKYTWEGYKSRKEQMEYAGQKMLEAFKKNDTGTAQVWSDKYNQYEREFKEYSDNYWKQENLKKKVP